MEISNFWAKNNWEIFHYLQANYEMAACQSHIMHNAVFTFFRMNEYPLTPFNLFMHWKTHDTLSYKTEKQQVHCPITR